MEHRFCKRVVVSMEAIIYHHTQAVARGRVRNMSQDGMFIAGIAMIFPIQSCVEVQLIARKNGYEDKYRLHAIVTHRSNEGVGLMFTTMSEDTFHNIETLLHERLQWEPDKVTASVS